MMQVDLLIVGGDSDPNTQRIVDQSHFRGIQYHFHNTDLPDQNRIAWDLRSPAIDLNQSQVIPNSIFARCNVFSPSTAICNQIHDLVQAYALVWRDVRILNRHSLANRNIKSENLRTAIELGFQIPETVILGDVSPLATLPNPADWIIKPLNGGATTILASDWIADSGHPIRSNGPWFLQRRIQGENLRIFVIGDKRFGFHLATTALDYRNDPEVQVRQIEVPAEIGATCSQMACKIGFDYCALDFRCRDGFEEPVFLEINSFPMFVRFDDAGGNCLADSILDFLISVPR